MDRLDAAREWLIATDNAIFLAGHIGAAGECLVELMTKFAASKDERIAQLERERDKFRKMVDLLYSYARIAKVAIPPDFLADEAESSMRSCATWKQRAEAAERERNQAIEALNIIRDRARSEEIIWDEDAVCEALKAIRGLAETAIKGGKPTSGKFPISRPCSACSGGDEEMKHHDHEAISDYVLRMKLNWMVSEICTFIEEDFRGFDADGQGPCTCEQCLVLAIREKFYKHGKPKESTHQPPASPSSETGSEVRQESSPQPQPPAPERSEDSSQVAEED